MSLGLLEMPPGPPATLQMQCPGAGSSLGDTLASHGLLCHLQALPYVALLIVMLFFIYAVIGMQVGRAPVPRPELCPQTSPYVPPGPQERRGVLGGQQGVSLARCHSGYGHQTCGRLQPRPTGAPHPLPPFLSPSSGPSTPPSPTAHTSLHGRLPGTSVPPHSWWEDPQALRRAPQTVGGPLVR